VDGILGHNLLLSLAFFRCESLRGWDFLGHNFLLSQASFFTMEFGLSRSLSHELFSFFTMFSRAFFFFHDGILAITKPFSRTFSFFTMGFWLSRSLFHKLFLFSRWDSGYHEAFFTNFFFFHDGILAIRDLGEDTFYTYITKSIYIGSASLKTLLLDLEPPLQGKEYGPSYSNTTRKRKANVFFRNHL
jgi:hypothetical protein